MMLDFLKKIPIYHISSMARSGETLLLRSLASHPQIHVSHNISKVDSIYEKELFSFLKTYPHQKIRITNRFLKDKNLKSDSVLLIKQGVWEHKYPFRGFILSRNPVSIYASLRMFDAMELGNDLDKNWYKNEERMLRWLNDIAPELKIHFVHKNPIDQFCLFYNRRMGALIKTGLPIIYYEHFVMHPGQILKAILSIMNISFDECVLHSHTLYKNGNIGHGNIQLDKYINTSSLKKYQSIVSKQEFDKIVKKTKDVACNQYKYNFSWNEITIDS